MNVRTAALKWAAIGLILTATAVEAGSRSLAGAYLAARQAAQRNDLSAAARYFTAALALDPSNLRLREQALNFKIMTGDLSNGAVLAEILVKDQPGHRLANLTLVADAFVAADFDAAAKRLRDNESSFSPLLAGLLLGWAEIGRGDADAAEAAFLSLDSNAMFELFGNYHLGLARASIGDLEGAVAAFESAASDGAAPGARLARAHGAALELLGRKDEARKIYESSIEAGRGDRLLEAELARLERGGTPQLLVLSARSGAAEAMFSIAGALSQDRGRDNGAGLLYAQLAVALRPEMHEARLLAAELLEAVGQFEMAVDMFADIPRSSPFFVSAEVGRAAALRQLDRTPEAILALQTLTAEYPEAMSAHLALGDILRREKRFEEAAEAYTRAIDLIDAPERRHWALFYERGICFERSGQWEQAQADFFKALELEPDQPLVLNYLGYSWVELGINLDEAQAMIEKAVNQRPDDGYITDSLGWVLYRIGKYDEAVPYLERAVELAPVDPIINDHFGDALWMVGRKLEARFQWKRALSFEPDEKDAERIRQKLAKGLDAVLRAEESKASAIKDDDGSAGVSDDG